MTSSTPPSTRRTRRASARPSTSWPPSSARIPAPSRRLRRELAEFHPRFVVNQVRAPADIAVGHQLVTACARHLGVRASYAGFVHYDDVVWRAVRQRRLFAEKDPESAPADDVRRIARGLVEGETMALRW